MGRNDTGGGANIGRPIGEPQAENARRLLVAGLGNIFRGDDAFGVEVVRRLAQRQWPAAVHVVDFGIRGFDLAYAILDGYDKVILVDASQRGRAPGTLSVIDPDLGPLEHAEHPPGLPDGHNMNPLHVLQWVTFQGGHVPHLRLIACEPATLGADDDPILGLSAPVELVLDEAVRLVESEIENWMSERGYDCHRPRHSKFC